jgi:ubiquinone/menaquinone biosynthesis C-methylase UbiE
MHSPETTLTQSSAGCCGSEPEPAALSCSLPSSGCKDSCQDSASDAGNYLSPPSSWVSRLFQTGFDNALELCLESLPEEPRNILVIGGCRQMRFARKLALSFVRSRIVVVDPDTSQVARAQAIIQCRLKFHHGKTEDLPFDSDAFDLTIGHNIFEFVDDWDKAMNSIARVTKGHVIWSVPDGSSRMVAKLWPAFAQWLADEGITIPDKSRIPEWNQMLRVMARYGKLRTKYHPAPWQLMIARMKPLREDRLILE